MIDRRTLAKLGAIAISLVFGATLSAAQATAGAPAQSVWEQPAAALAEQIAGAMGPGQARLTIRNNSTIATDEIPAIRKLLEQDLKVHGVVASGAESASAIRVTLSENVRERLWVAEVVEGNETHVSMVHVEPGATRRDAAGSGLVLRSQTVMESKQPVLAAMEMQTALAALVPEAIVLYDKNGANWQEQKRVAIGQKRAPARDARGAILANASGDGFEAFAAGVECSVDLPPGAAEGAWTIRCRDSDDPWPVMTAQAGGSGDSLKAFYNGARDYFTGVVAPSVGVDLPAFYSAALLRRPAGAGLLVGGIDGKVQLVENGALKTVSGTRDWGSDFAVLHSGCGGGDQVIASGSGEALSDSLRAYELPALEAVPASAPLAMDGTVTAMWSTPDGKSVMAAVRHAGGDYEVDRVTALCD
jgi:hypothetical protein